MSMKFLLGISILALFISCSDLKRPDQIERLQQFEVTLDSLNLTLSEIDSNALVEIIHASKEVNEKVEVLELDTIEYEFAVQLDRFNRMGEDGRWAQKMTKALSEDLLLEKKAVVSLMTDIEQGNGKREKYDEYIQFEEDKLSELRTRITECVERVSNTIVVYDELDGVLKVRINEQIHL